MHNVLQAIDGLYPWTMYGFLTLGVAMALWACWPISAYLKLSGSLIPIFGMLASLGLCKLVEFLHGHMVVDACLSVFFGMIAGAVFIAAVSKRSLRPPVRHD